MQQSFPLITSDDVDSIPEVMEQLGLWQDGESIESVARAGEGNMNLVLRVRTNQRSVILKQSRPWVEKYPDIAAPAERVFAEIDFYNRVASCEDVRTRMPQMLGSDNRLRLLALEDVGEASDYSDLYAKRRPEEMPLECAIEWLARLHAIPVAPGDRALIGNISLRKLNHAHVYAIPLQRPSAIDLDQVCDGMEELAESLRSDSRIRQLANRMSYIYLGSGPHLLHGDYYPGSWLRTEDGLRVIDPEFTFAGPAEFDLGVLVGHSVLIGGAEDQADRVCELYQSSGGARIDRSLVNGFADVEIIRRLIGVAQLPIEADLAERTRMINTACVLGGAGSSRPSDGGTS